MRYYKVRQQYDSNAWNNVNRWSSTLVESNPEFMACLRQSQIDKKKGKTRKYEDIAKECGLRR